MTAEQFEAWAPTSVAGFAAQQVAAGLLPEADAAERARAMFAELLPDGPATPGHHLWTVRRQTPDGPVVGHLWMRVLRSADDRAALEAFVLDVEVDPALRGTGLGRATMRAGEQAARDLGASVVRLNVFGHNTAALRLYDRLGYAVVSSTMTRRLGPRTSPVPGPVVDLRDMTPPEYAVFRERIEQAYADDIARATGIAPAYAARRAAEDLERLLPEGLATGGHRLWTAYDGPGADAARVGHVWVGLQHRSDGLHAFGFDLEVAEDRRRQGWGRALMVAAEQACHDLGATSVGLSVFGFNHGARALYEQQGYRLTAQTRAKAL